MRKITIAITLAAATAAILAGTRPAPKAPVTATGASVNNPLSAHCAQVKKENPARKNVRAHRTPAGVLVTSYNLGEGIEVERVGF